MNNFTLSEFRCSCCGQSEMDLDFQHRIDLARDVANVPFIINSGFRCSKHNTAIGSTSINHTVGKAADISTTTGFERGRILKGLYKAGFERIGIRKDFIHVDSMDKVESCWLY